MSDEESFVILGTSSLSSLESDTPGSNFSSLRRSQLLDLQDARKNLTQTPEPVMVAASSATQQSVNETQTTATDGHKYSSLIKSIQQTEGSDQENSSKRNMETTVEAQMAVKSIESIKTDAYKAESKLSSLAAQVLKNTDEEYSLSLEDCAIKSPLGSINQQKEDIIASQNVTSNSNPRSLEKTCIAASSVHNSESPSTSANKSLASSFIMGEINADFLKTNVYSQFPSICMHSSAEEVVKLQSMVTENLELKSILEKVNNTMRFFHSSSLQWQDKMNNLETKYKQELDGCQKEIEMLRKANHTLQDNLKTQIEAIEIARQKDREETIKEISEKSSLVENMRAQIVKLEKKQMGSSSSSSSSDKIKNDFDKYYITREEHNLKIKEFERQLSELLASNLDFIDIEKQYVDELNCLKVNLAAAEELIKTNQATIAQLEGQDQDRQKRIKQLEMAIENLREENATQKERILVLEQQNQVYRKDFEIEQEGRSIAVKEKHEMFQDLRNLQKRNQELIAEHQKFVDNYEKRVNNSLKASEMNQSFVSGAAAAQTYFNNPQRPIRNLPSPSSNTQAVSSNIALHSCPICNKAFRSLSILQSHVNDCIDRN